ncbi:hypothetical protein BH11PLA2_BH11PLA2_49300 [soil metagenome]
MRAYLLSAVTLSLIGFVMAEDKNPEKFESKEGTYKVMFPGKPTTTEKSEETKIGTIKFISSELKQANGNEYFNITFVDYPFKKEQYNVKKGLDGAVKGGANAKSGMKVTDSKEIEFGKGKLPGRDAKMENEEKKLFSRGRYIFDDSKMRMYILVLVGSKDFVHGKAGDAFLDSFELVEKK